MSRQDVIQVSVRVSASVKMLIINKASTVSQLFERVRGDILGEKNNPDANFYLICNGEELDENSYQTLDSIGITHGSCIDICQRVKGGSGRLQPLPGKISLTKEPCCIDYDDNPATNRAKMPCGCAISADAMKRYCASEMAMGRYKFPCPNCGSAWRFFLVRHVLSASMSEKELERLSMKVNDNYFGNSPALQQCPSCKTHCERTDPKNNRVVCSICTSTKGTTFEFCWACLKPWKEAYAGNPCGNSGCSGKDARLRYLESCPTKTIGQVPSVPSVRMCEKCGNIINHLSACKHMTCKCGHNFCFVCLKPQINEKWQCGDPYDSCSVAPRQTSLPV